MQPLAVDEYQDIGVAQTVHLHLTAHVALAESKRCGESAQNVLERAAAIVAQHLPGDDLGLHGRVLQQVLCASTRDDDLLQRVLLLNGLRFQCLARQA